MLAVLSSATPNLGTWFPGSFLSRDLNADSAGRSLGELRRRSPSSSQPQIRNEGELDLRNERGFAGAIIAFHSLVLEVFSLMAKKSANLGIKDGKLLPCPDTPNCVCSMDSAAAHHVEPLAFIGDPDDAMSWLKAVLAGQTRTRLVAEEADYLHAECSSLIFRFVDDLEFYMDRLGKKIHVRSASRAGRYDFGVNRRRVEAIRMAFEPHA
jgi:uncharacterized protein (DUF1499 family)